MSHLSDGKCIMPRWPHLAGRSSRPSGFGMASLATLLLLGAADVSREQPQETMLFTTKTTGLCCRNLKVIPWGPHETWDYWWFIGGLLGLLMGLLCV